MDYPVITLLRSHDGFDACSHDGLSDDTAEAL
jgi:hypothetical protein